MMAELFFAGEDKSLKIKKLQAQERAFRRQESGENLFYDRNEIRKKAKKKAAEKSYTGYQAQAFVEAYMEGYDEGYQQAISAMNKGR
ncbi:MAG: hypothetical protein LBT86_05410 [Deltaproteobacteria bacterium]|jgi:hypothetical protein|nr:hypothetical protein [Deltaproteobacteria bacterium]